MEKKLMLASAHDATRSPEEGGRPQKKGSDGPLALAEKASTGLNGKAGGILPPVSACCAADIIVGLRGLEETRALSR
jgi:hypothetical protein